jgi:hypothetical protein
MTITLPFSPAPAATTDRQLLAAASRALREAGWVTDFRTPADWRRCRSSRDGRLLVAWIPAATKGVWELEIWHPLGGTLELTDVPVTGAQQAIDVVAALLGVGVHLTSGYRFATAAYCPEHRPAGAR